jgi:hypothetical protein
VMYVCSCRPLQSLAEHQGASACAAPLPWSSPEAGLGTLPKIALRCLLHAALRSGSFGLPRILPGLTTDSACAGRGRTFEVFRTASQINRHCCQRIIDPLFGSPTEHLPAARTGSRRPPLLGSDRSPGFPRTPGPIAPPSALHLLAKDRCASTPGTEPRPITFGLRMPIRKSRSDLVVSHHLAGFLRARAGRLVASCSRPWGSPRFTRTSRSQPRSPRRDHPSKDDPICPWYSGHPEPWPPWRSTLLTPNRARHC